MKQELLTLSEHLSSPLVFSGIRVARSLALCECFVDRCLSFCTCLPIVLSVHLRLTDSDYSFAILKLFLLKYTTYMNRTSGILVSVFAWNAVFCAVESLSSQIEDFEIGIFCFYAKHVSLRSKSKN